MAKRTAFNHETYHERTAALAASMTETAEQMRGPAKNVSRLDACFETFGEQGEPA